jgi:hypothetical protein
MNSFSIDFGFDWNIRKEDRDLHLQECFYMQIPTIGTPSYFGVAAVGDMIDFNIYDITARMSEPPNVSRTILQGTVTFRSADGNGPSTPFGSNVGDTILLPSGPPLDLAGSLTFNGQYPHWQSKEPYQVAVAGRFIYTAELTVQQDGNETKVFIVDPEMETGSGG